MARVIIPLNEFLSLSLSLSLYLSIYLSIYCHMSLSIIRLDKSSKRHMEGVLVA